MSADPLAIHGVAGDLNPYAYVGGQVTTATDLTGVEGDEDSAPAPETTDLSAVVDAMAARDVVLVGEGMQRDGDALQAQLIANLDVDKLQAIMDQETRSVAAGPGEADPGDIMTWPEIKAGLQRVVEFGGGLLAGIQFSGNPATSVAASVAGVVSHEGPAKWGAGLGLTIGGSFQILVGLGGDVESGGELVLSDGLAGPLAIGQGVSSTAAIENGAIGFGAGIAVLMAAGKGGSCGGGGCGGSYGSGKPAHTAEVTVNRDSRTIVQQTLESGNMTAEEKALGFPQSSLATHTEARAVAQIPLQPVTP